MSNFLSSRAGPRSIRRILLLTVLVLIAMGLTILALALPTLQRQSTLQLEPGQVALQDLVAPKVLTFVSEIQTNQQRENARQAVQPIYTSPDTSIARQQLERLRAALVYISNVRADAFATPVQKEHDLAALEEINLDEETIHEMLALSDSRWQAIQQEAILVIEQMMRTTIRESQLDEAQRAVPSLVSLALPEEQASIVAKLAAAFIAPNSFYSDSLTEAARQKARDAVSPINRTFVPGEIVVQRGQVISEVDLEALRQLGLVRSEDRWRDLAGIAALTILVFVYILIYLNQKEGLRQDTRGITLILSLFLIFLFLARLTIPDHTVIPYIFPLTTFSLTVAALFGAEPALVFTLPLAVLYAYGLPNTLELTIYFIFSGIFGLFTLGSARRVVSFFWASVAVAASGALVILAFRFPDPTTDWIGIATLTGAAVVNGIASAGLTILIQYFLAQFLGLTTALQLMELSRPDASMLQFILRNAPGTYQHSLQVANLAEQAAERIGADPLLTRVGALYHDAGKAVNPFYFIENQMPGNINPHDDLDPTISSATIIRHVTAGLELAHRYRLPARLRAFINEHHGTLLASYQYARAVEAAAGDESLVDKRRYQYPGPRPQSKETAILMLADGCEARVRAERPKDEAALKALIKSVIENRLKQGQLDDTNLTLRELEQIGESFTTNLRGIYHPRIEYPVLEKNTAMIKEPLREVPTSPLQSSGLPIQSHADPELEK